MTGRMLEALERVMLEVRPALVLVMGDTNSTLAGALAAAKLGLPVAHVEAGLRSHDARMPEEINRRLTDHVSRLLFCPTPEAVANLRGEGIRSGVHRVGDVMMDAVVQNRARARRRSGSAARPAARSYYLATLHRQENVDDPDRLLRLVEALRALPRPAVLLVHPRTRERLSALGLAAGGALRLRGPASYLETLHLLEGAQAILTDSGGLQKEAYILHTPCITLRDTTEWVETLAAGANVLVGADPRKIRRAVAAIEDRRPAWRTPRVYGDGRAAEKIARVLARFCRSAG